MSKTNSENYQNDAYLCFSESDADFAEVLEDALLRYKIPAHNGQHSRHLNIFQDSPALSDAGYADILSQQLQRSRKMIVICSKAARWDVAFNEKIRKFTTCNGVENIIPIVSITKNSAENDLEEWLPEALRDAENIPAPLIFSDFDVSENVPDIGSTHQTVWIALLGKIIEMHPEKILQIESQRSRRHKKRRIFLLTSAAVLLVIAAGAMIWQNQHKDNLQNRTSAAELFNQRGKIMGQDNQHLLSLHLLAEALALRPEAGLVNEIRQSMRPFLPQTRLVNIIRHDHGITGACYNHDRALFATWDNGGVIQLRKSENGQLFSQPIQLNNGIRGVRFVENDQQLLLWEKGGLLQRWDISTAKAVAKPLRVGNIIDLQLTGDASLALARCEDFTVRLIDLQNWKLLGEASHDGWIGGAIFNAAETEFLTWSDDSTMRRWDVSSVKPLDKSLKHGSEINGAIYIDNEKYIMSWGNDGVIEQWEVATSRRVGKGFQHDGAVIGASMVNGGRRLLTWSRDNTARLWDMRTGALSIPPLGHEGWVFGALMNPVNTAILTWSFDNTLRLWDAKTGEALGMPMRHFSGDLGNAHGVFGAAISDDGEQILSWGADNAIRLWNLRTQNQAGAAMMHGGKISSPHQIGAIFSSDFSEILTWSADSTARLWKKNDPTNDFAAITTQNVTQIIQALTGTRLDSQSRKVVCLSPEQWAERKKKLSKLFP